MGAEGVEGVVEVPEFDQFYAWRDQMLVPGRPDDGFRGVEGGGRLGGERAAVAADHGDAGVHAAASAIFTWPVKSTMMTLI
jgi:hypothetical protein